MSRLRTVLSSRLIALIETALMGLFFVQSLRLFIGLLYSRTSSLTLMSTYPASAIPANTPGIVNPETVATELAFLGVLFAAPLLMLLLGRFSWVTWLTVVIAAVGRVLVVLPDSPLTQTIASELTIAACAAFIVTLVQRRATLFPYFFILGFGLDQVIRAYGNTLDPSMQPTYLNVQLGLSIAVVVTSLLANFLRSNTPTTEADTGFDANRGILTLWGGIGFGALLFLQLALFALPNALTARTDADYTLFVPIVLVATLLPLVPFVRAQARNLIAPFDSSTRGWLWLIIIVALVIFGLRVPRIAIAGNEFLVGAFILSLAQVMISLLWWWFVRPKANRERNYAGLWLSLGGFILAIFVGLDLLTFEYAYVQGFAAPLDTLNSIVVPLMRGFRGLGLLVILLAVFLAALPMVVSIRRVAWPAGTRMETFLSLVVIIAMGGIAAYFARPIAVVPVLNVDSYNIGTYNIHSGYSEFYDYNLRGIASAIQQSGVEVLLLQDVEAGRLTSFGVDQSLWLARTLRMDVRYFGTNESLFGLAVLSEVPIVYDDGFLLPSVGQQTGLQRVQIQPDQSVLKIYNTSLGLLLEGNSVQEQERGQREQLDAALDLIRIHIETDYNGQLGRAILGGTFNNVPNSPLLQTLQTTGFIDPFAGTPPDRSDTLIRVGSNARIDYLWLWRDSLTPIGYNVIRDNESSDHRLAFIGIEG